MRILIYGFGPYRQFKQNITQQIVGKLFRSASLKKIVFPVRFDRRQFTDAVKQYRPDVVLGLGQCSRGRLLRIERRAINRKRTNGKERARPIVRGGPRRLPTTLKLEILGPGKSIKVSRDAGDYVCNFSMYVMLDYLRRHRFETRLAFLHVPYNHDRRAAVRFVRKVLSKFKSLT